MARTTASTAAETSPPRRTLTTPPGCAGGPFAADPGRLPRVILVVDDDEPVRVMLARLLRTQGYSIVEAGSAVEAYARLAEQQPDLVITDIVMPGESGIELRRSLSKRSPELPVILISGYSAEGPAEFAARTPHTAFVQKPFAAEELLTLVRETLAQHAPPA